MHSLSGYSQPPTIPREVVIHCSTIAHSEGPTIFSSVHISTGSLSLYFSYSFLSDPTSINLTTIQVFSFFPSNSHQALTTLTCVVAFLQPSGLTYLFMVDKYTHFLSLRVMLNLLVRTGFQRFLFLYLHF